MGLENLSYSALIRLAKTRIEKFKEAKTEQEKLHLGKRVTEVTNELKKRDSEVSTTINKSNSGIYNPYFDFDNDELKDSNLIAKIVIVFYLFLLLLIYFTIN